MQKNRLSVLALALAVILLGDPLAPMSAKEPDEGPRTDLEVLLQAKRLDDAAIGYAGQRTTEYDAFSRLCKASKTSIEDAKHLVRAGTPAGRVYGILILRRVAPSDAASLVDGMLSDPSPVMVENDCIVSHSTVRELVSRIQKGEQIIFLPK